MVRVSGMLMHPAIVGGSVNAATTIASARVTMCVGAVSTSPITSVYVASSFIVLISVVLRTKSSKRDS